ncbi:MAG: hypothetical protein NTW74_11505 [Acidobacteria bacterium]|nr:hypothetical protein [Acidobacteriota bacterium]
MRISLLLFSLIPLACTAESPLRVTPSALAPGKEYSVLITDPACQLDANKAIFVDKTRFPLFGLSPGVKFSALTEGPNRCEFNFTAKVAADSNPGTIHIPLFSATLAADQKTFEAKEIIQQVAFDLNAVQKGPIPPGVDAKGEVDVAYDILPYRVTADNFGRRVAETYFAIQATIGNSTGYSLLLSSLFFRPKVFSNTVLALTPNTQYGAVRSTLEREQQVGRRAITVGVARGVIPMLGTAGSLVNATASAEYAVASGLYGLSEKVLEIVYPDKTVRQLVALDTRTFRDGMIIKNNDQKPILFFIHRSIVMCVRKETGCAATFETNVTSNAPRLNYVKEFNPVKVKELLGHLNLIGEQISFANRLVVTSVDESKVGVAPPPTMYEVNSPDPVKQGGNGQITVSGINLDTITVSPVGGALEKGITIGSPKLTGDKSLATIEVKIAEDAKPGTYPVSLAASGLARAVMIKVLAENTQIDSGLPEKLSMANESSTEINLKGKFLAGAKIKGSVDLSGVSLAEQACTKDACKIIVKAKITPFTGTAPKTGEIKLEIVKPGVSTLEPKAIEITVNKN